MDKTVIGLLEKVKIIGDEDENKITARIDTGATKSSIDLSLASSLKLGPVIASTLIKSSNGTKLRPVILAEIEICGKKIKEQFNLADRSHMQYQILIGRNILKQGFIIDPNKELKE